VTLLILTESEASLVRISGGIARALLEPDCRAVSPEILTGSLSSPSGCTYPRIRVSSSPASGILRRPCGRHLLLTPLTLERGKQVALVESSFEVLENRPYSGDIER